MVGDFKTLVLKYETSDIISQSCGLTGVINLNACFSFADKNRLKFFSKKSFKKHKYECNHNREWKKPNVLYIVFPL